MIAVFEKLDEGETELMLKAPILVCILIAGADGTIDKKEIKEGITLASRLTQSKSVLTEYFKEVATDFEDKLMVLLQGYPSGPSERSTAIVKELTILNAILQKLPLSFSASFYEMLRQLALKIASSSGGLLGIHSIGSEEAQFVELPMINNPA